MASPYGMSQPHYSQYADTGTRVNSFVGWPCDSGQSPVDLANAGFFYTGKNMCIMYPFIDMNVGSTSRAHKLFPDSGYELTA